MENEKYLFVVSGAAGTGKDSVVSALRKAHPEIEKTVSATTRAPRPGEQEGRRLLLPHQGAVPAAHRSAIRWWSTTSSTATTTAPCSEEVNKRLERGQAGGAWSSMCTARPTSAACIPVRDHHLPAAAVRGGAGAPSAGPRHRDRGKHPGAPRHRPNKELAQQDKFTLKLVNDEVDACAARTL